MPFILAISIISEADDFECHFFFFFGGSQQLPRGNYSASSVDVEPAAFAVKEETVAAGIIAKKLGKLLKFVVLSDFFKPL